MNQYYDITPLINEMRLEKGKVYSFIGRVAIGKTKLMTDITAYLLSNTDMKGIFCTTTERDSLSDTILQFNNVEILLHCKRMKYLFGDYAFDGDTFFSDIAAEGTDFLIIDSVYPYDSENIATPLISRLKEFAKERNIIIICTARQNVKYGIDNPRSVFIRTAEKNAGTKQLTEQSDFVAFMDMVPYYNPDYPGVYNDDDSVDFIITKGKNGQKTIKIEHLRKPDRTPDKFFESMVPNNHMS